MACVTAIAVGLSLFFACSIATLLAVLLLAAIDRLGGDPAFGSGPLATAIRDLLDPHLLRRGRRDRVSA
jgi:magnesium transporter